MNQIDDREEPALVPAKHGRTYWKLAHANRLSLIVDADVYFRSCRAALLKARRRIMLIGWDFDARIQLSRQRTKGEPRTLGEFVLWLVRGRPELEVYLLRWDVGAIRTLFRGTTAFTLAKWMLHKRIHTRLDHATPTGASHHHKIVVIDDQTAFCGGIDMTSNRWDTRDHLDDDPRRSMSGGGATYAPWHDTTMALSGDAAAALGALARQRWHYAGGADLAPVHNAEDCWPDLLGVQFENVRVGIARTNPKGPVLEIEKSYLMMISRARRFIYAESQYFASRRIAEAMARRLAEPNGPEIVLINPQSSHGWLEPIAMDTARARLFEALRRQDSHRRLRLYHPFTTGGTSIYVHSKLMVVDDEILHVGSSNMNNRSMRLDTECDISLDASLLGNEQAKTEIGRIRDGLVAEHLGVEPAAFSAVLRTTGSLIATVERLRHAGRSLREYETPLLNEVEKWLADNEVLDPESAEEAFEELASRSLFRRFLRRPS